MIIVQRSAIETWQKCRRKRWWEYEWEGIGLSPIRKSADLFIGSAVHMGLEVLLQGGTVEQAVICAHNWFSDATQQAGIVAIDGSTQDVDEAQAIIEALVRSWAAVRLQSWFDEYEVIETEREESYQIESDMTFLSRTDAIVRRKGDGTKFLVNFKTAKECDQRWRDKWRYDVQTLSEVLPVEARLVEKLGGVIIEGLVKGGKEQKWSSLAGQQRRTYSSPLIWPWVKRGEPPMSRDEWSPVYEWMDSDGRNRRLGKGWERVPIWLEPMGVKGWIEYLLANNRTIVEQQFVTLPAIMRSEWEVEEWQSVVRVDERLVKASAEYTQRHPELLGQTFPRETGNGNCTFPSRCPFFECCWETAGQDPIGSGLYVPRIPNHPAETELRNQGADNGRS